MTRLAKRIFYKELVSYKKRSSTYLSPIVFFLITIALYPLALSNDPADLAFLAPGITWICVLLSTLLSIQNIFNEDFEDGSLDIFFSLRVSTLSLVIVKILVNWIFSSLPSREGDHRGPMKDFLYNKSAVVEFLQMFISL